MRRIPSSFCRSLFRRCNQCSYRIKGKRNFHKNKTFGVIFQVISIKMMSMKLKLLCWCTFIQTTSSLIYFWQTIPSNKGHSLRTKPCCPCLVGLQIMIFKGMSAMSRPTPSNAYKLPLVFCTTLMFFLWSLCSCIKGILIYMYMPLECCPAWTSTLRRLARVS